MQALNIKKITAAALIATCAGLLGTSVHAAGAYTSNATGATIVNKGTWYRTNFPIVGPSPASTSRIANVSWSYSIGTIRPGLTFEARLCHGTTLSCIDVSNVKNGSSSAFVNRTATTTLFLEYRVTGSTAFIPLNGNPAQVTVTWND